MSETAWTLEHVALAAADLGAWTYDVITQQVTWSDRVFEIFGVERGAFGGTFAAVLAQIPEEDRTRLQHELQIVLNSTQDAWQMTHRVDRRGALVWVNARGRVLRDEHGRALRVAGVLQDVTAVRAAEEERREQSALMQAALDASLFAVVVLDRSGRVMYSNELCASLLGLTRSELEASAYDAPQFKYTELDGRPWPSEKQAFVRVMETGEPVRGVEHGFERPDGRKITVRTNGAPIKNEHGEIKWSVFSFEDITERRAIEEGFRQAQKMEAIGRLAGGVAHDFNNLMTAILSFAALARAEVNTRQVVLESLDGIAEAGQRATQLTRQLLTFGRRDISRPANLDARLELSSTVRLIERVLGEGVRMQVELGAEPCWVHIDPTQLQQVLLNVALNARDAMKDGGGTLTMAVSRAVSRAVSPNVAGSVTAKQRRASVSIRVSDTGHGMDELTMHRAFEPFFTTKAPNEGTGLGLSTCHGIITQALGSIALSSEPGRGTRVDIELPFSGPPSPNPQANPRPLAPAQPARTGRILVVEDDAAVQRIAVRSLQKAGHQVLAAPDAKTALTLLNEQTFDVIVCDLALPGLSGPDFIERVRATRATCASHATQHTSSHALAEFTTRVLFVSGYSAELARTGEDSFLPKPYTPEALRQRVLELLASLPQIATASAVPRAVVSGAGELTQPQHDEV